MRVSAAPDPIRGQWSRRPRAHHGTTPSEELKKSVADLLQSTAPLEIPPHRGIPRRAPKTVTARFRQSAVKREVNGMKKAYPSSGADARVCASPAMRCAASSLRAPGEPRSDLHRRRAQAPPRRGKRPPLPPRNSEEPSPSDSATHGVTSPHVTPSDRRSPGRSRPRNAGASLALHRRGRAFTPQGRTWPSTSTLRYLPQNFITKKRGSGLGCPARAGGIRPRLLHRRRPFRNYEGIHPEDSITSATCHPGGKLPVAKRPSGPIRPSTTRRPLQTSRDH